MGLARGWLEGSASRWSVREDPGARRSRGPRRAAGSGRHPEARARSWVLWRLQQRKPRDFPGAGCWSGAPRCCRAETVVSRSRFPRADGALRQSPTWRRWSRARAQRPDLLGLALPRQKLIVERFEGFIRQQKPLWLCQAAEPAVCLGARWRGSVRRFRRALGFHI